MPGHNNNNIWMFSSTRARPAAVLDIATMAVSAVPVSDQDSSTSMQNKLGSSRDAPRRECGRGRHAQAAAGESACLVQRPDQAEGGGRGGRQEPERAEADQEPAQRRHGCRQLEAAVEDLHDGCNAL